MSRRVIALGPFLTALAAWSIGVWHRSLWTDEFHTLYHARAHTLLDLLESVRTDNHPPLGFLLAWVGRTVLGESELALRLPSLVAALALLVLGSRLAQRLAEPAARLAPWLIAASSYLLWIAASARMYALLALCTLALADSALAVLEERRSRWWIALWTALGLHTHYHFFHHGALLAFAGLALAWRHPALRSRLWRCAPPALVGLAAFVPWAAFAFVHQLEAGDPPTSAYRGLSFWIQSYAHFLFLDAGAGGAAVRFGVALPGALAAAVLGGLGFARTLRATRSEREAPFACVLLALGLALPTWIYLASLVHTRSGFHLKYLSSAAVPVLLLVAAGAGGARWQRALGGFVLLAMLTVTAVDAASPGRQDVRGAVDFVLDHTRSGDAIVTHAWWFRDPARSPTDFDWYAERIGAGRLAPVVVPVERVADAFVHRRVWLIHTGGYPGFAPRALAMQFGVPVEIPFGPEASVYLYSRRRSARSR